MTASAIGTLEPGGAAIAFQASPVELVCSEVWGGNREVYAPVNIPGLRGLLYSRPCNGPRGGDVPYLTSCDSGLMSRICLADVVGHGEQVAQVSDWLHRLLRNNMNTRDARRIFIALNSRLAEAGGGAMTTAACLTYYAHKAQLSFCYAGHPPAWIYRRVTDEWSELTLPDTEPHRRPDAANAAVSNLPLGIQADTKFQGATTTIEPGDRLLLLSDGVLEAQSPNGQFFGRAGLREVLDRHRHVDFVALGQSLVEDLFDFAGRRPFTHDDVTLVLLEATTRARGPIIWHLLRNQWRKRFAKGSRASTADR